MNLFAENITAIRDRSPTVGSQIEAAATDAPLPWASHGSEKTLVVNGVQLTSAFGRRREAELQANLVPETGRTATVYGFALGDLQRVLLERKALTNLKVIIMNAELAALCCRAVDQTDWLQDPRVSLHFAWDEVDVTYPFSVAPAALRLAETRSVRIRDAVHLALAKPFQDRHFREMDEILDARLEENLPFIEMDGDVATLFGSAEGRTIAVVAGGPTASEQFEWLRAKRDDIQVVAVSTALRSLVAAEMVPDQVVVIDPKSEMVDHFKGVEMPKLTGTPLVYLPTVHRKVIEMWPGPRLVTYIQRPRFEQLARTVSRGVLFCDGSVTHVAVDLAVRMAAKMIVLIGADFCFPDQKRHVDGAVHNTPVSDGEGAAHPSVVNGLGHRTPSRTDMVGFLRDLEGYIARHPTVIFRNTGRAGATITGAEWLDE